MSGRVAAACQRGFCLASELRGVAGQYTQLLVMSGECVIWYYIQSLPPAQETVQRTREADTSTLTRTGLRSPALASACTASVCVAEKRPACTHGHSQLPALHTLLPGCHLGSRYSSCCIMESHTTGTCKR